MSKRYWLKIGKSRRREVSRARFIQAERDAGFHRKNGGKGLATGGFAIMGHGVSVQGTITITRQTPVYELRYPEGHDLRSDPDPQRFTARNDESARRKIARTYKIKGRITVQKLQDACGAYGLFRDGKRVSLSSLPKKQLSRV